MNQSVLDAAVNMATKAAMNGTPIARIVWMPPASGASDPGGTFAVQYHQAGTASDSDPWQSR